MEPKARPYARHGNDWLGAASSALNVIIDATAPVTPAIAAYSTNSGTVADGITNDNTLTLTGSAAANNSLSLHNALPSQLAANNFHFA